MKRRLLAILAYMLPAFILWQLWHTVLFASHYKTLEVYRSNVLVPLSLAALIVQGLIWSVIYEQFCLGETVGRGAIRFAAIAFPIAWSYQVLLVGARHPMTSNGGYLLLETSYLLMLFALVSPLIASVYVKQPKV
jgi:hydrogenase-4 membrane subunit HyfE